MVTALAPTVTMRPATASDAPALSEIYAVHALTGTATFDLVPISVDDFAAKIGHCAARRWPFIVAVDDDAVVGYAYAAQIRDRPGYASTCENSIYVAQAHIGRGIGTALLDALLRESEASGFRQMVAVIGGEEPASVALHASRGFVRVGQLRSVGRKFGRWIDTVYMQRALGAGDSTPPATEPGQG